MNINRAPISRVISTAAKNEASFAAPPAFANDGTLSTVSLASGKAVTVFFETPSYPLISNQIWIKLSPQTSAAPSVIHALPNVYMTDADSYLFIRGNSVIANAATATDGIHVVYSAIIEGLLPVSRANDSAATWVRPGDTLSISAPTGYSSSNAATVQTVAAQVITVRQRSNNAFLVDFTVGIDPDLVVSGISGWAKNDLLFHKGTAASPTDILGLGRDQLSLDVSGSVSGNVAWKGIIRSPVNLSYPSANKTGIIPAVNSSEFLLATKAWVANSGIPSTGTALDIYSDPDYNSGAMPFKCISIVDNSTTGHYNLEVSIIPMY